MVYIYIGILGFYLVLFLLSLREEGNPFQKIAARFFRRQQRRRKRKGRGKRDWKQELYLRQLGDKLKTLEPGIAAEKQIQNHYLSQYSMLLMVVFVGDLLCLAAWVSAHGNPKLTEGRYLSRNAYGEGEVSVGLVAEIPGIQEEIFDYLVEERKYTNKEIEAFYQEVVEFLPTVILDKNEKLEDVRQDLDLVSALEGYPFQISWESSAYSLINTDGTVHNEELTDSKIVTLTASLRYEDWSGELVFPVQVNPVVYTSEEALRGRMEELLRENEESTKNEQVMVLPEQMGTEPIIWREIIEDSSGYFLILVLLAAGVIYWGRGRDLD
ncbi:MAG: hypothetical protein K2N00_07090, partial [Lachnospiraceae bacterium]|nr:hypothetical protein [Lachnospiraceae bacterium]